MDVASNSTFSHHINYDGDHNNDAKELRQDLVSSSLFGGQSPSDRGRSVRGLEIGDMQEVNFSYLAEIHRKSSCWEKIF